MSIFGHQPDGLIYIDTKTPIPIEFFADRHRDYALPHGAIRREYMQGEYHTIEYADGAIEDGPMPWDEGDMLIADIDDDVSAYEKAIEPVPVPDDVPDEQRQAAALEAARNAALRALDDQRLALAASSPSAPDAVKEYAVLKATVEQAAVLEAAPAEAVVVAK